MRHHYVPQFLLKPWADATPDGRVEVFRLDLKDFPSNRRTPKHTGFEEDLYALSRPIVAGMEKHAVEVQFLRHVDNLGARGRRKLEDGLLNALTMTERADWIRFLMSLRVRQPGIVGQLKHESETQLRAHLATHPEEYNANASEGAPPNLTEWTEQRFPGLIENFGMSFFNKLVENVEVGNMIYQMRWLVWDFGSIDRDLLLSDHPCIFTAGINDPKLVIALPISPKKAFMAIRDDNILMTFERLGSKALAMRLNESSLGQASARIYARNRTALRFIENRLSNRPSLVFPATGIPPN